jgi:hypothetical protein
VVSGEWYCHVTTSLNDVSKWKDGFNDIKLSKDIQLIPYEFSKKLYRSYKADKSQKKD